MSPKDVRSLVPQQVRRRQPCIGGLCRSPLPGWSGVDEQPTFAAVMAGEFLVITGEGDVYSEEQAREWLDMTGWRALERKALAGPMSVVLAETTP